MSILRTSHTICKFTSENTHGHSIHPESREHARLQPCPDFLIEHLEDLSTRTSPYSPALCTGSFAPALERTEIERRLQVGGMPRAARSIQYLDDVVELPWVREAQGMTASSVATCRERPDAPGSSTPLSQHPQHSTPGHMPAFRNRSWRCVAPATCDLRICVWI